MIEEPVMCAWDANGRMYVAEMRSYMQDTGGTGRNEPIGLSQIEEPLLNQSWRVARSSVRVK
jgi:hypothetical protein